MLCGSRSVNSLTPILLFFSLEPEKNQGEKINFGDPRAEYEEISRTFGVLLVWVLVLLLAIFYRCGNFLTDRSCFVTHFVSVFLINFIVSPWSFFFWLSREKALNLPKEWAFGNLGTPLAPSQARVPIFGVHSVAKISPLSRPLYSTKKMLFVQNKKLSDEAEE